MIEDVDSTGHFCHPACPAFERYLGLYRSVVAAEATPTSAPSFISWRGNGWRNLGFQVVQPAFAHGEGKGMALLNLKNIADAA